jgi:hypothetical protein
MVTARSVHHPIFARLYPDMARTMERGGMAEHLPAGDNSTDAFPGTRQGRVPWHGGPTPLTGSAAL